VKIGFLSTANAVLQQCYPRPVQSIAVLILGRFCIPHLAIGQVLSGIWAKQCSQPGGSEKLLCGHKLGHKLSNRRAQGGSEPEQSIGPGFIASVVGPLSAKDWD
jgi:hypothetical protein